MFKKNPKENIEKSEFEHKLLDLARVVRVVAGGRRFSFRALVILGNRRGKVAMGIAKGQDVAKAVEKAVNKAKKDIILVSLKDTTIPHEVYSKYGAAKVLLKPAVKGKGLVAGGAVRVICDLAGIKDVTGKILSKSNNKINNARAAIAALKKLKTSARRQAVIKK